MPLDTTEPATPKIIFAAYAESDEELRHIELLADSLRTFGGNFSQAPVWAYLPELLATSINSSLSARLKALGVDIKKTRFPPTPSGYTMPVKRLPPVTPKPKPRTK